MDPVLARHPLTPTRAKSVGPSSPHLSPMEDTNSSGTRKRPRLDSGERTYRSMSVDRLKASPSDSRAAGGSPPVMPSTEPIEVNSSSPASSFTPTKVTINVREPLASGSSPVPSTEVADGSALPTEDSSQVPLGSPNVVSVHSSPLHSPEIEVAEIEDMSDEPAVTQWRPLRSNSFDAKQVQTAMILEFPYLDQSRNWRKAMNLLAVTFEKNDLASGEVLQNLSNWIESYLEATEPLSENWLDMFHEEREFWEELPCLVDGMTRRNHPRLGTIKVLTVDTEGVPEQLDPLQNFLCAYAALVLRMATIDRQTLRDSSEDPTETPDLVTDKYLNTLWNLVFCKAMFWRNLVNVNTYDSKATVLEMIVRFTLPPTNGVKCLVDLSEEVMDRSQSLPAILQKSWICIHIMVQVAYQYGQLDSSDPRRGQLSFLPPLLLSFFQRMDVRLQLFISKQVSALSIESCQSLISVLSELVLLLAQADGSFAQRYLRERGLLFHGLAPEEWPRLIRSSWKCDILRKCIVEGRMEIRVQGVETLSQDLLSAYTEYIRDRPLPPAHPIPQFLSDFLVNSRLVQYFVGVDSHPQLIQRCSNIIGFLLVTHRYTDADTDAIWNAVATSQDSRSAEAILVMAVQFFHISNYASLLYFMKKLNELPIQAFDNVMLTFGRNLLQYLCDKWKQLQHDGRMDMPPYDLCIRLIRQSAPDGPYDIDQTRAVHRFAAIELRSLLQFGPSDEDRKTIYRDCLLDISDRNESATGSISAISALLNYNPEDETRRLAEEFNLTDLLVQDLAHMVEKECRSSSSSSRVHERLQCRLNLLYSVIIFAPHTVSPEAAKHLWDVTVGACALDDLARDSAWQVLLNVLVSTRYKNPFIDACIQDFLPGLHWRYMVLGCLSFAKSVSQYHLHTADSRSDGEQLEGPTASELLWHLSLTAPSGKGNLEYKAIGMLVTLYLDSPDVHRRTREATDAVHIQLVERCISQLTAAASKLRSFSDGTSSGEDEPMIIVASDEEVQVQRLSFTRSIMILKEFVGGVRARPMYSPPPQPQPKLPQDFHKIKGEPLKIRYQSFSGGSNTEIRTVEVGDLETIEDLSRRLTSLTGYAKFTPIAGGQKLDFPNLRSQTLRELDFSSKGLLLIKKAVDSDHVPDLLSTSDLRPMEVEILSHFKEMYPLLGMEDNLAHQVFEFLIAFPPHSSITSLVCSKDTPLEEAFPVALPFKILYSVHALRLCLRHQLRSGTATPIFISHSIHILSATLTAANINIGLHGAGVDLAVAAGLIDCLLGFLKESVASMESTSPITNASLFIERLRSLILDALAIDFSPEAEDLVCNSLSTLLEASLHYESCWNAFRDNCDLSSLLRKLLLEESKDTVRQAVSKTIKGVCSVLPASVTPPADFVPCFWNSISSLISSSTASGNRSEQFFDVANILLRSLGQAHRESLDILRCVQDWSGLLLRHRHTEFVGRNEIDFVVLGLSRLLLHCFQLSKSLGRPIQIPPNFMEALFRTHLFPDLSNPVEGGQDITRVPNLHTSTRDILYSIVLALSNDLNSFQTLLRLVKDLLVKDEGKQAWSWGIADVSEDVYFDTNWNFERAKLVRSSPGYSGLRNLSNTCYMNSLFTQLFMNINFRDFMLNANVADGGSSQKLLQETQNLFAYMQGSVLKSVDTQGIADSIVTYESTPIDVSVQMDVDEFYNLLFDRWESQILTSTDKKTFRRFYGGQIVQQIKSQECSHISERLEPFSAIQCDISGKTTLAESLNAYVKGEFMKGDNKYSCTSCGSYVDAVKRACFKDTPDNLIFHLKRFDYDLMTGTRSKINDRFEFPREIDMAPYMIDSLKDTDSSSPPDVFELVGILVHSGTAESGHYYSYIQERPSKTTGQKTWVEYNDAEVTEFNPNSIDDQCFGGMTRPDEYATRFTKVWNAYMLFYERINPRQAEPLSQAIVQPDIPIKCKMPAGLETRIATHNETFLRHYCLFDPAHAAFVRSLLEQLRSLNKGTCSEDHVMEKGAIWLALEHLDQVLARTKEFAIFDRMLAALTRVIGSCPTCCKLALDWVTYYDHPLRDLLLRCPHAKVRKDFSGMIIMALQYLRKNESSWYNFEEADENDSDSSETRVYEANFYGIARRLEDLWPSLAGHLRAWDDYFGLLAEMASLGKQETYVLLRTSFLYNSLEILLIDHASIRTHRYRSTQYGELVRMLDKGRKLSYAKHIELLANLLTKIDFSCPSVHNVANERPFNSGHMPLTAAEEELVRFRQERTKSTVPFLEKILNAASNSQATKRIIQALILAEPQNRLHSAVQRTIEGGINVDPAYLAAPYLRAALSFCECSHSAGAIENVIKYIASEVHTIGTSGGREHLDFFAQARRLRSLRPERAPLLFSRFVLRCMDAWAPELLQYWEEAVRTGTLDLIKSLLFNHDTNMMDDEELADELVGVGRKLAQACTQRCEVHVHLAKPVDGKCVEQIMTVIRHCLERYYDESDEVSEAVSHIENILDSLEALTVSDVDDVASDQWNNGSDEIPSDEDSDFMGSP